MNIIVNISDAQTSAKPDDTIVTYALGSCIGVALWDPVARVGGMLHFQLPTSTMDAQRAKDNPLMFADSGMDVLLDKMQAMGAQKKRMKVKLAGAAEMLNDAKVFNIGRRNHAAIRKVLWQHGMFIDKEDIGGSTPRNLYLHVADGTVSVRAQNKETKL